MGKIPWYVARSSGIVAWALILATIVWGLLLATKVLGRRPGPAWLLSLHRYLGALTIAFVSVHVGAILLDSYTDFGITDVFVPFTGSWHPVAVAWGIVGMYLADRHRDHVAAASPHVEAGVARGPPAQLLPLRHHHGAHAHRGDRREGAGRVDRSGDARRRRDLRGDRALRVAPRHRRAPDRGAPDPGSDRVTV